MRFRILSYSVLFFFVSSCSTRLPQGDDGKISLTLVQVNDVYEIAPLEGGKSGGMARVATLKQQELKKDKNTFLVMSGDFISPSVYGSLTYEGKRIRGRQMIDVMNVAGFDLVGLGNHEFDISEKELQERIDESKFRWIATNAFHKVNKEETSFRNNKTSEAFPKYYFQTITDADGTSAKIGFISVVLPANPAEYVSYKDPITAAVETYNLIRDSCDAIIAITHLAIKDDRRLAQALPGLAAILGGHEHDMKFEKEKRVYITKAHANAKSAYVVKININKKRKKAKVDPRLIYLNEAFALDTTTDRIVQKWVKIANDNYASSGFDAKAIVPYNGEPLDGRESLTRSSTTNLTRLITEAMLFASPNAAAAVFNSGSIRVDDILYAPLTQYDVLRTLPFGGGIKEIDITGDLLMQVLNAGITNKGSGGWLQYGNITANTAAGKWDLKGQAIDPSKKYRVAVPDFLITGKEANLSFFNEKNPGVLKVYPAQTASGHLQSDIRLAVIRYLESKK